MAYFEIFRGTQAEVNAQAIIDGQILYTTDLGVDDKIYKDVGSNRTILSNDNGIAQSYTPTATNLGTISNHTAMVKSGIGRYKLIANIGTWVAGTDYEVCILSSIYRPTVAVNKKVIIRNDGSTGVVANFYIGTGGNVIIKPYTAITSTSIQIDETYII